MSKDDGIGFPKPEPKKKSPRKGLRRGRSRSGFTTPQQRQREEHERLYRTVTRPKYLLDLARRQGRLSVPDDDLPGGTLAEKWSLLMGAEQPRCEIQAPGTECAELGGKPARQIHHRKGRDRRKSDPHLLNDTTYFVAVCGECHEHVESHRSWAYQNGWLLSRTRKDEG